MRITIGARIEIDICGGHSAVVPISAPQPEPVSLQSTSPVAQLSATSDETGLVANACEGPATVPVNKRVVRPHPPRDRREAREREMEAMANPGTVSVVRPGFG